MIPLPDKFLSTPSARRATLLPMLPEQPVRDISIHALREEGDHRTQKQMGQRCNFYPRPPRGGRHNCQTHDKTMFCISIHALREEGDQQTTQRPRPKVDFYPRPPRGGRHPGYHGPDIFKPFLSTPSARRATAGPARLIDLLGISIHALREEGDLGIRIYWTAHLIFLSTPSARRATSSSPFKSRPAAYFYPRPPRGGRRRKPLRGVLCIQFLSTPSARRATICVSSSEFSSKDFYPRPPRGGRPRRSRPLVGAGEFLSTPSARRATT